ncbi:MAG: hypothetical protein WC070_02500 [Candidatus Magasanikbacteria bacterium]
MKYNNLGGNSPQANFSLVYFYLTAGIALSIMVFLFVPKISMG